MTTSEIFGAIAVLAAVALYGAVHSLLASRRLKSTSQQMFGRWHDRFYRLFYNITGAVTFVPVLAIVGLTDSAHLYQIPAPWIWLTTALQLAAVVALVVGVSQTDPMEFLGLKQLMGQQEVTQELVRAGLYRWVRHPLYFAGLVLIWLMPVMTSNILSLNIGLTLYLYIGSIFEERKLLRQWGATYEEYRRQVPRLIPLPWHHL